MSQWEEGRRPAPAPFWKFWDPGSGWGGVLLVLVLLALVLLQLPGCTESNAERIEEAAKCREAGMRAVLERDERLPMIGDRIRCKPIEGVTP